MWYFCLFLWLHNVSMPNIIFLCFIWIFFFFFRNFGSCVCVNQSATKVTQAFIVKLSVLQRCNLQELFEIIPWSPRSIFWPYRCWIRKKFFEKILPCFCASLLATVRGFSSECGKRCKWMCRKCCKYNLTIFASLFLFLYSSVIVPDKVDFWSAILRKIIHYVERKTCRYFLKHLLFFFFFYENSNLWCCA